MGILSYKITGNGKLKVFIIFKIRQRLIKKIIIIIK